MKERVLQIRCNTCKAWNKVEVKLGDIAYFRVGACWKCDDRAHFDSKSTQTYNPDNFKDVKG